MNRIIQNEIDPLCLYPSPDLEPAFKALRSAWPSFYVLLQEHFSLKSAPSFWLDMAPSANLGKEKAHKEEDVCHVTQQRFVLGFALFTTVTDLGDGRQTFNDMWCCAGKNWQSIQGQIYCWKSSCKMGEVSGGKNKVLSSAGEVLTLKWRNKFHCCSAETTYTLQWIVIWKCQQWHEQGKQ